MENVTKSNLVIRRGHIITHKTLERAFSRRKSIDTDRQHVCIPRSPRHDSHSAAVPEIVVVSGSVKLPETLGTGATELPECYADARASDGRRVA